MSVAHQLSALNPAGGWTGRHAGKWSLLTQLRVLQPLQRPPFHPATFGCDTLRGQEEGSGPQGRRRLAPLPTWAERGVAPCSPPSPSAGQLPAPASPCSGRRCRTAATASAPVRTGATYRRPATSLTASSAAARPAASTLAARVVQRGARRSRSGRAAQWRRASTSPSRPLGSRLHPGSWHRSRLGWRPTWQPWRRAAGRRLRSKCGSTTSSGATRCPSRQASTGGLQCTAAS